jgi:hypothetical protein
LISALGVNPEFGWRLAKAVVLKNKVLLLKENLLVSPTETPNPTAETSILSPCPREKSVMILIPCDAEKAKDES